MDFIEETLNIPIEINANLAWFIREQLRPGPSVEKGHPASEGREKIYNLRLKVDAAILRFIDEDDLKVVEIRITPDEAWMIDHTVNFDGPDGIGTQLLIKLFRGLWAHEMGIPLDIVEDPNQDWSSNTYKNMPRKKKNIV